jgi:hypothetical protein
MAHGSKHTKTITLGIHTERFKKWYNRQGVTRNNGSYWYAKEIENIILPYINKKLFIVTAAAKLYSPIEIPDGSIVVCHDNRTPEKSYGNLFNKNILWICSKYSTVKKMKSFGERATYVPLSIDTEYVKKFKSKKTKEAAFVGNAWGFKKSYLASLPKDITQLSNLEREDLLKAMAKYKYVIAEGRCLMEAQVLGCKCEVPKYETLEAVYVEPLDSRDAIPYWIEALKDEPEHHIMRTTRTFKDLQAKKKRGIGEVFTVSNERAAELINAKVCELI